MASLALVPARRLWLAAAIVGAMLLLVVPAVRGQETTTELPASVESAVIAAAAAEAEVDEDEVEILRVEAVTWNDGCLGAQESGEACTQALVDGYVAWVLAGGTVHRFHTDAESEVRLGQTGILTSAVATAPLPSGATAREQDDSVIGGEIPDAGVALFQVTSDATVEQIRTELESQGCVSNTLAKTVSGRWYIYGYDSPAFANAGFFSADDSTVGSVQAETILLTNCEGTAPSPTPSPSPTPTPGGFSTNDIDESDREGSGALADVRLGDHQGYERIVFEFADDLGAPFELVDGVPGYTVGYETDPVQCGSGFPVEVDAAATLVINFPTTFSYNPETGEALVTEPNVDATAVDDILDVEQSCAFEGVTTWVIGLDSEVGFRVIEGADPARLVVDIETD